MNNTQLNEAQKRCVHFQGRLLVVAGAGTGKTRMIIEKIECLLAHSLTGNQIVALTFTNKAANEMKDRLTRALNDPKSKRGIRIGTFHSFGLSLLERFGQHIGLGTGFSIFDTGDVKRLISGLLTANDLTLTPEFLAQRISAFKTQMKSPLQVKEEATDQAERAAADYYDRYERHLKAYRALDFDDLIYRASKLLKIDEVAAFVRRHVQHLLIDEYQDTNQAQYMFFKALVAHGADFTLVGDDDQSIYGWRGAHPENMKRLSQDFDSIEVIKLEENYRSTETILHAANTLISHNPHIYDKTLVSLGSKGDPIEVIALESDMEEAQTVAYRIFSTISQQLALPGECAVLYRNNYQARLLEIALSQYQIDYEVSGSLSFFEREEIRHLMAYIRLLMNEQDDNAFLRVINVPRREIGAKALEKLASFSNTIEKSLYESISSVAINEYLKPDLVLHLRQFVFWMERLKEEMHDPFAMIHHLIEDIDYENWLFAESASAKQAQKRLDNVQFFLQMLKRRFDSLKLKQADKGFQTDADIFRTLIRQMMLHDLIQAKDDAADSKGRVQLLTVHSAKGLEFEAIWIMGLEEGLLPHQNSLLQPELLNEERRLFYVAMTRAKRHLTLSYALKRKIQGQMQETTPSRFLDELPQSALHQESLGHQDLKVVDEATQADHLDVLRKMLLD